MNLDDLKGVYLNPENPAQNMSENEISFSEEISRHLAAKRKKALLWAAILIMLSFIYSAIGVRAEIPVKYGYTILYGVFIFSAIYLFFRNRKAAGTPVTASVKKYLIASEKALRYMGINDLIFVLTALSAMGIGGGIIFVSRLERYFHNEEMLKIVWVVFYVLLCAFGFWAGKKDWQKENGELLARIRKQVKDFEQDEN